MPELPDVEVFKRYFDSTSLHKKIKDVEVHTRAILENISPQRLESSIKGHRFKSTRRHGKYLFAEVTGGNILALHFGMTGFLKYFKDPETDTPHDRLLIRFSNGYHLAYDCQRKLGMITVIDDLHDFIKKKNLGPDAMDPKFDFDAFEEVLAASRGMVKSSLMNQNLIAGIGNVYSDEILFQAGVHPKTTSKDLSKKAKKKLFSTMKRVLKTVINNKAHPEDFPSTYLTPHRNKGADCPKCDGSLKTAKVSGRTSYYCDNCQQRGN